MRHAGTGRSLAAAGMAVAMTAALLSGAVPAGAQPAEAAAPPTVQVEITKFHNVKMPTSLRPGVHRFVVRSTRNAALQLVKPRAGYTKRQLAHDVRVGFEDDPRAFRRFERRTVFLGGVSSEGRGPAAVMFARVPRGRVWALDTNAPRTLPRKVRTLDVAGARLRGVLRGVATLRAVGEHEFAERPRAIPGSGRLVLRNPSRANHFFSLVRLRKGKTVTDFAEWLEGATNDDQGAPPVNFDVAVESGVIGPDRAMSMRYALPPGRYVLLCWWPDADMGMAPHAVLGMFRGVRMR